MLRKKIEVDKYGFEIQDEPPEIKTKP